MGPWSCLSLPEGPWTRWLCSGPHVPPLRRDPSLALLMTPPEGVSALSREGSKQAGSVVEVRAPQHFSDAPEERGGAYPHWGQARKVPRGWAGRAARWRPPPPRCPCPTCSWIFWVRSTCHRGQRGDGGGAVPRGSPRTTGPRAAPVLWPSVTESQEGVDWSRGSEAGGLMGMLHAPAPRS